MECQVRSMAASRLADDVTIPEGKVQAVCREWLVREDGVLAYKLQSEEIQHHYGHNKEKNQLVRSDFQEARSAQKSEEEEATMVQLAYEKMLKEQEDRDAFIAQQLQEKMLQEEIEQQKLIEEEDQRIALELQKKEKLRLQRKREERELRQAEKARAELSGASNSSSIKSIDDLDTTTQDANTSPLEKSFSGLSLEPPPNLTPEELQKFIEYRDAELARLLQEQEMKSHKTSDLDRQMAIEAQDRELAKVLQEQERARAKKARERARQKAAMAQNQDIKSHKTSDLDRQMAIEAQDRELAKVLQEQERARALLHYSLPDIQPHTPGSIEGESSGVKETLKSPDWSTADRRSFASDFSGDPVNNIAAALDPTFNNGHTPYSSPSRISSPSTPASSPITEVSPYSVGTVGDGIFLGNEEDSIAPPYMPIQGTRRPSSLEKSKKSKKSKESCKTQ